MPRSIPEVVQCGDTIRDDERCSQADQLTSIRQSYVAATVEINPECIGREQAESIDSKRREQAIEFKRLDHLWGVNGENITSMHESRQRIQRLELEMNYLSSRKQLLRRNDDVLLDGLMILPGCQALTIGGLCWDSIDIDHPKLTEGVEVYGSSYNMHKGSSGGLPHNQLSPLHPASLDGPWRNKALLQAARSRKFSVGLRQHHKDLIVGRKAKHIQFSQLTGAENRQPRSDVTGPVTLGKTVSGLLLLG
jgi:hypothetical protein